MAKITNTFRLKLLFSQFLVLFFSAVSTLAAPPFLIKDIEQLRKGPLGNSTRAALTDNLILFVGEDDQHGDELWITDGTTSGTRLLKDINPGSEGSAIFEMVRVPLSGGGARIVFTAFEPDHGTELWESDGTVPGTRMVADLDNGSTSSFPSELTNINNDSVAFSVSSSAVGSEIFIYNVSANTVTPLELNPGIDGSVPRNLQFFGNQNALYFSGVTPAQGAELRRLNLSNNTFSTIEVCPGSASSFPGQIVESQSLTPFRVFPAIDCSGGRGRELFITSGNPPSSASFLKDINPGLGNAFLESGESILTAVGTLIVFSANNGTTGFEPWVTNGTAGGTIQLADILPGIDSSQGLPLSQTFFPTANGLVFAARSPSLGVEIWRTLGTPATTVPLLDINPGIASSFPDNFLASDFGIRAIFSADDGSAGSELWITDGTSAGTQPVADINAGEDGSLIFGVKTGISQAFFNGIQDGQFKLFKTDGTSSGTAAFAESAGSSTFGSDIETCASFGDRVFIELSTLLTGEEGWISDATDAGTFLLKDIEKGPGGSSPRGPAVELNGALIFAAADNENGEELWKSDGTEAGTELLANIRPGFNGAVIGEITRFGSSLLFSADDGVHGSELWISDGTNPGTHLLKDINPGAPGSFPFEFSVVGARVIFKALTVANGTELWVSDGTDSGTVLVKDIRLGPPNSQISNLVQIDGGVVFSATDSALPAQLWISNGTSTGTVPITNKNGGVTLSDGVGMGSFALLSAFALDSGGELWRTDGTSAGTTLIHEFVAGIEGGFPTEFVSLGSKAFFTVTTPSEGAEPWVSDGSSAGTILLKDINPGPDGSSVNSATAESGFVYFGANDLTHGFELWRTDGTSSGTVLAGDISPGPDSSFAFPLCGNHGILYMSAGTAETGSELFGVVVDECPDDSAKLERGVCGCGVVDQDLNGNGIVDCLTNDELKFKLQKARSLLKKLKLNGDTFTPSAKKARKSLKGLNKEIGEFVQFSAASIVLNNNSTSVTVLTKTTQKAIKRALKGDPATFSADKKAAQKGVNKFLSRLG